MKKHKCEATDESGNICRRKATHKCEDCGSYYCKECADNVLFECDCNEPQNIKEIGENE